MPWTSFASGHRVALVVPHRAQKSVPDSAGEWPTFLPPPLESCYGTANVDGPNSFWMFLQRHNSLWGPDGWILLGNVFQHSNTHSNLHASTHKLHQLHRNFVIAWISNHIIQYSVGCNEGVSQMRTPLAVCREPAGNQSKATKGTICFWT